MMKRTLLFIFLALQFIGNAQERNYLLHSDANIERLKSQISLNEAVRESWETQYKQAEKLLKKDRLKAADCQLLGLAYRMTGKSKFAEAIKAILIDYTKRDTWESKTLLSRTPKWKGGLKTSHTSFYIAIGYDCIYNFLKENERQEIAEDFARVGITPAREDWLLPNTDFHTFDTMGHNWWSACVYMAGFSSLAIRNELPEAQKWVDEIADTAKEWIDYSGSVLQNKPPTFDKDGGFYESINYASYGVSQYLLFRYAFQSALPEVKQVELPILDKIGDFFIQTSYYVKDDKVMSVNFGDSFIHKTGNSCVTLLWNLGYTADKYAWYIDKVSQGTDNEGMQLETPNGLLLHPKLPKLADDFVPNLATSHLFKDMGWATLRNSWEDNATMLAVKSGFTWNHTHADAGSYILFHKGKNLIIDSGNASYLSPLYTEYYCQSEAHNVVMFNSEGQNRKDIYFGVTNQGALHNLVEGKNFKYLLANATGPYAHILSRNYRNFVWVGDVILVIDDLLAHRPGKFEWLLHYNGESELKGGIDLTIKEDGAKVLVRPLYPETFPPGGERPHDFPEHMLLTEKMGYEDHHPEQTKPYWSISHFEETARTKFVSAIILEDEENKDNLPVIERFEGTDFLGVSISQNGKTTEVYLNLLADGRLKHRNSVIDMNGWQTDAYLTVLTFKEGADKSNIENIEELFIGHGSYLRRNGKTLMHSHSKYTALVEDFNSENLKVEFQGQANTTLSIHTINASTTVDIDQNVEVQSFDRNLDITQLKITEQVKKIK
ncbi:heparinase II/III family protein [uncultured Zobellia sp.]|uniref:heparinase II/III domain-containing protein n=1 Tax=uncultured Zobellia sp. TaxID=255433 RepID=UPI002599E6F2|nr:heparinase II/III family protein [uncultured Zobellia sp.]